MGEITIAGKNVSEMSDFDLAYWMRGFKDYKLRDDTLNIWIAIMRTFDEQGVPQTVRGVFYRCENVHHVVDKSKAGYMAIQRQVLAMRRAGVLPYGWIADGTRWIHKPITYTGLRSYLEHGTKAYRRALWDNQKDYVVFICEKDAITSILWDVTEPWDVPLLPVRGYCSETFAFEAAQAIKESGKPAYVYYFGDYDKHGLSISKDIESKLDRFGANATFERVTVNEWQIEAWGLPTRETKDKDFGDCVEVDAVPAKKLRELARDVIARHIDKNEYDQTMRAEKLERKTLEDILNNSALVPNSLEVRS